MKIRKFNEEYDQPIDRIWIIMETEDCTGDYWYIHGAFSSEILAADSLIKYINAEYDQNFEPYFDENDGSRFFLTLSENEDYQRCKEYLNENNNGTSIKIYSYPIITSSKIKVLNKR